MGIRTCAVKRLVGSLPQVPRERIRIAAAYLQSTLVNGREPMVCMPRPRWRLLVGEEGSGVHPLCLQQRRKSLFLSF